jgi:RNA polymerase sigma-70 factor (ECF subfamily)
LKAGFKNIDTIHESEIKSSVEFENMEPSELLSLINQLPDGYKMVFNLYAIDEYSHKEIAQSLNISESTSRTQYLKARNYLKKLLLARQHNDDI